MVVLRNERHGQDIRHLEAYLEPDGSLTLAGHDIGPGTAPVSSDGEYEWWRTIRVEHLPRLLELLDLPSDGNVLDLLSSFTGRRSYKLEQVIRESDIPVETSVWSG